MIEDLVCVLWLIQSQSEGRTTSTAQLQINSYELLQVLILLKEFSYLLLCLLRHMNHHFFPFRCRDFDIIIIF